MSTNTTLETFLSTLPKHEGKPRLDFGGVVIESKLYEVALGAAFLGRHIAFDVPVVVKVMHPGVRAQMKDFKKYIDESKRLSQVRHPNVTGVLDLGEVGEHAFMIFEYACGVPLNLRLKDRPMSQTQALSLLTPVAEGLREFWRKGFVHRSVCPDIIYIQCEGGAKLEQTVLRRNYTDPQFKAYLAPFAAPYWSPEELRDQPVDPSSDMWSFGATLFHAALGEPPFETNAQGGAYASVLYGEPRDPKSLNPEINPAFRDLLLKLLSKHPEDRFLSAEAFIAAMHSVSAQVGGTPLAPKTIMFSELPTPAGRNAAPVAKIEVGSVIGNCLLNKEAGAGAFGVVYLARHRVLDIDVAVKILPAEAATKDPNFVDLFLREARTAARLRHPNVIGIFEAGEQDGQHYLIMEFAPNGTVWERMTLQGGKLPIAEARRILLDAARGLTAAEKFNIIHRDIKPDNLMFGHDDEVKIADLGLAKRLPSRDTTIIGESVKAHLLTQKTAPEGAMAGTPAYMAPEMAMTPDNVDTRADLYSLGVTAYQMLTGKLPFEGKTTVEVLMKHISEVPLPIRALRPETPEGLSNIVMKLMAKDRGDRHKSAQDLVRAIEADGARAPAAS